MAAYAYRAVRFCLQCFTSDCIHMQPMGPHLTRSEIRLLLLLARGSTYEEIRAHLSHVGGKTTSVLLTRVYEKLGFYEMRGPTRGDYRSMAMRWAEKHRKGLEKALKNGSRN